MCETPTDRKARELREFHQAVGTEQRDVNAKPTETLCQEVERLINGEKRESYGPVEESFENLATLFSVVLRKKLTKPVNREEANLLLIALKLFRETERHKRDNLVDLIGYTLLLGKLTGEE